MPTDLRLLLVFFLISNSGVFRIWIRKLGAQFSQHRILVIIKHLAFYKIGDSFTFANFSTAYTLTGALYGRDAKT